MGFGGEKMKSRVVCGAICIVGALFFSLIGLYLRCAILSIMAIVLFGIGSLIYDKPSDAFTSRRIDTKIKVKKEE